MATFDDIGSFVNKIDNIASDELGLGNEFTSKGKAAPVAPWIGTAFDPKQEEIFWRPIQLDPSRWDKLYPYRLLVVDISKSKPRVLTGSSRNTGGSQEFTNPEGGIEYVITQQAQPGKWEVVLPITPQQLQIQDQFSINTTATMRGIVEEHNGVKFKMITASGTTGIWPRKPTKGGKIGQPTSIGTIAGGTLQGLQDVAGGLSRAARSFNGEHPNAVSSAPTPFESDGGIFSTGYYQAMYLGQFFERYAQLKKKPENKDLRLVFDIPKQNQSFVVTPIAYNFNQNHQKPNEMLFTMQLRAWKRIDLQQDTTAASSELPDIGDPSLFQRIANTIDNTRRTLSQASNLIKAVRGDARGVFNILRQTSLAAKDLGGLVISAGDLPDQIINDAKDTIQESLSNVEDAFNRGPGGGGFSAATSSGNTTSNPLTADVSSSSEKAGAAIDSILDRQESNEGLSRDAVANGALGNEAAQRLETDPLNTIFENPGENFDLFSSLSVDDLDLSTKQQNAVEDELDRTRLFTIDDLRRFKKDILNLSLEISDNFGAGDDTFSEIFNTPTPRDRAVPLSVEENEIMVSLFETIQAYDLLTSTKQFNDLNEEDPLEFVGGLADEANIDFESFPSKMLVPVPFGSTIEEIAARHLGDADKWIEIATINNLRSPYIDEEGFTLNMLSNAQGRQLNVNDTESRLFVGQTIIIQSDVVPPFTRTVINVEKIGDENFLVTVDGSSDLDNLTTNDNARIKGFLPGTVNSQNQIYIPVNQPSEDDDRFFEIPSLDQPNLTKISKVDFLLTEDFDIAINSVGEFRLANGLTNLIQALKMKIKTRRGSLLRHLDFGLGLEVGISVADIEQGQLIESLNQMVRGDNRFDFIESATFTLRGSTLAIDLSVRLANDTGIVPINFETKLN